MMKNENPDILETEPIGKLLWKMAIPSIVGVMAYNLYNIFDTLFISLGTGIDAVGGVSVSFPLFIFLSAVSTTLGNGGASVISRALGEKDYEKVNKTAANTFLAFYITAILITVFGVLLLDKLLYIMGITEALLPYARDYTRIILLGAVTSTGFSNLIRAEGNGRYAMLIWVIPMIANIILDLILIFVFQLGVVGAATATVFAQAVSMCMSIYYFFLSGKSVLRLLPQHFIPDRKLLGEIVIIGIPSFLQMAGLSFSIIIMNRFLKTFGGTLTINAYGIISKIHTFLLFPITGLTQGLQPIIGYNKGARRKERIWEALKWSALASAGYGIMMYFITLLFAKQMVQIFTTDIKTVYLGARVLMIINAGLFFSGLQYVQATYFQAVGEKKTALLLALCNYAVFFVPVLIVMTEFYGLDGVWFTIPISTIITLVLSSILLRMNLLS